MAGSDYQFYHIPVMDERWDDALAWAKKNKDPGTDKLLFFPAGKEAKMYGHLTGVFFFRDREYAMRFKLMFGGK
jgi:hypothetical protein